VINLSFFEKSCYNTLTYNAIKIVLFPAASYICYNFTAVLNVILFLFVTFKFQIVSFREYFL